MQITEQTLAGAEPTATHATKADGSQLKALKTRALERLHPALAPGLVLVLGLAFTAMLAVVSSDAVTTADAERFERFADRVEHSIERQLSTTGSAVQSAATLLAARSATQVDVQGALSQAMSQAGAPALGFCARSDLDRCSVVQFEPASAAQPFGVGFDLLSDPSLRDAIERAAGSAEVAVSGPVALKIGETPTALVLVAPVYRPGQTLRGVEERRRALGGVSFAVVTAEQLLARTSELVSSKLYGMAIVLEGPGIGSARLFASPERFIPINPPSQRELRLGKNRLLLEMWPTRAFSATSRTWRIFVILIAGLAASLLFAALTMLESRARIRAQQTSRELAESDLSLRRANRAKDEFLAMLGHELRNPLGALSNAIKVIRMRGVEDATSGRALDVADRQVRHQTRLVDDLLDLTRLAEGKLKLDLGRMDLREAAQRAIATARTAADKRSQRLELKLPNAPLVVEADLVRVEQIFVNLLMNAIRATPPGGRVELELRETKHEAVARVRDGGAGIEPADLKQIFNPFFQGRAERGGAAGGLGIGLSIVQRLVELHGGSVGATSAGRGRGAEFRVSLPLARGRAKQLLTPRPSAPPRQAALTLSDSAHGRKALIVEDNADARSMLRDLLERVGLEVEESDCGERAIELVLAQRPELVVVDIGLPDITGLEVARRLRSSAGNSLCLVALSGYGSPDDVRRSLAAGFDAHLVKPLDLQRLLDLVSELFEKAPRSTVQARRAG
jgi:signal transduction histidine kinase/CheY-like chemotaxis protein